MAKCIGEVIDEIRSDLDGRGFEYEVVIVDGRSSDGTRDIAAGRGGGGGGGAAQGVWESVQDRLRAGAGGPHRHHGWRLDLPGRGHSSG